MRNEIVKKQTQELVEKLDFLISMQKTNIFGDTLDMTLLYYLKGANNLNYFKGNDVYTKFLIDYANNANDGKHTPLKLPKAILVNSNGTSFQINTVLLSDNVTKYLNNLDSMAGDPYFSDNLRAEASHAIGLILDFESNQIPVIITKVLSSNLSDTDYLPSNIIQTTNNMFYQHERQIQAEIDKMKAEIIQTLRLHELYNVAK